MLGLYYTGAPQYLDAQADAAKSLGGFISNTFFINNVPNNIFPDLGYNTVTESGEYSNCIGIAAIFSELDKIDVTDNGANEFKNITITLTSTTEGYDDKIKYYLALGPINGNQTSGRYMELLLSSQATPSYLLSEDGFCQLILNEPIVLKKVSILNDIGLWFRRIADISGIFRIDPCSDYWCTNDKLPNLDIDFNIKIDVEDWVDDSDSSLDVFEFPNTSVGYAFTTRNVFIPFDNANPYILRAYKKYTLYIDKVERLQGNSNYCSVSIATLTSTTVDSVGQLNISDTAQSITFRATMGEFNQRLVIWNGNYGSDGNLFKFTDIKLVLEDD